RNDVAAEHAVVRDVAVSEDHVVITHHREPVGRRGRMHGHVLAEDISRTDLYARIPAGEFQVLGLAADVREREDLTLRAENRVALDSCVMVQPRAVAQPDATTHKGERTDLDIGAQLGAFLDHGGGMYPRCHDYSPPSSTIANISSADDTTWPSTVQVHSAWAILSP